MGFSISILTESVAVVVRQNLSNYRNLASKQGPIVRVENAIDTASGIEVAADGERIADSEMATRVLVASAWERQWLELPASLPGTLSGLLPQARAIRDGLDPVQDRLQEVDAVIQRLRNDGIWEVATSVSPKVATVGEAILSLVDLTDRWFTVSQAVTERVPPLVEHVKEILIFRPEFTEVGWPAYSASPKHSPARILDSHVSVSVSRYALINFAARH